MTTQVSVTDDIIDEAFESFLSKSSNQREIADRFIKIYVERDNKKGVTRCIELGANLNTHIDVTPEGARECIRTPLLYIAYKRAISHNDYTIPHLMLKNGANPNLFKESVDEDEHGTWHIISNVLYLIASERIRTEIKIREMQLIIDAGGDVTITIDSGWTLLYSCTPRNIDVLRLLIKNGADINQIQRCKFTGLKWGRWNHLMIDIFNNVPSEEIQILLDLDINIYYKGLDDYEGTITGTPEGPLDIFDFLDTYPGHRGAKEIYYALHMKEKEKISAKLRHYPLPKIIKHKIAEYLKHPRCKLSGDKLL